MELKDEVSFDLVEKVWSEVQDKIDLTEQEILIMLGLSLAETLVHQYLLFTLFSGEEAAKRP